MGLEAETIKHLSRVMEMHLNGALTTEQAKVQASLIKEHRCFLRLHLDFLVACGKPSAIKNEMHEANLISKGEFVQLAENIELEMIQCPDMSDKLISRAECLSYSGESKNNESCSTCKNFNITRRLLLTTSAA